MKLDRTDLIWTIGLIFEMLVQMKKEDASIEDAVAGVGQIYRTLARKEREALR